MGPSILWPLNAEEVDVERLHVDRRMRRELGGVDRDDRADRVGGLGELAQRRDRAEGVRHAGDAQDLRALGEQRPELRQVEQAVVGERDVPQRPRR